MDWIYEKILALLEPITDLKWVDLEKGQLDQGQPPVSFPCAIVDINLVNSEDVDHKGLIQECTINITIRLGFDFTGNTSAATPADQRTKSLEYFKLERDVYEALQGYKDANINKLSRRNARTENRADGYKVRALNFSATYKDIIVIEDTDELDAILYAAGIYENGIYE